MNCCFKFLLFFLFFSTAHAKETDNLTGRYRFLEDSTELLDQEMRKRLRELETEANEEKIPCSNPRGMRILFNKLNKGKNFIGSLETWVEDNDKIPKRKATPENSIYKGVFKEAWFFDKIDLASTIKVNGVLVGTDKLGHFIDQGFTYYSHYRKKEGHSEYQKIWTALSGSAGEEKGAFGGKSTGTISYADSFANYQGLLFYHRLTEGHQPYFRCTEGKWKLVQEFTFADYINEAWDEGINCSVIPDSAKIEIYNQNIEKIEKEAQSLKKEQSYRCPVDKAACAKLIKNYASYAEFIISPVCKKEGLAYGSPPQSGGAPSLAPGAK